MCRRCGSDLAWLWLWCRSAAVAPIRPLAWEPPYAMSVALKRQKKKICHVNFLVPRSPWSLECPPKKVALSSLLSCPCHLGSSFIDSGAPEECSDHPFLVAFLRRLPMRPTFILSLSRVKAGNTQMLSLEQGLKRSCEPSHYNIFIQWDGSACVVISAGSVK